MKSLMMAVLGAGVAIAGATTLSQDSVQSSASPWLEGRCYRVFPSAPDEFHTFKVLERRDEIWVRVQPSPSSPSVPGARPQAPLWINTRSPFAVQEWSCDSP